ncbi:MAG: ParB/RepB/Spo0J family partition protein, partial [Bacteroidota bacterium]
MAKKSFKIKENLAEALGDTVNSAKNNAGELYVEIIPLRKIELDPDNPRDLALSFEDLYQGISNQDETLERKNTEKEALASLTKSIKEQGIINPIVVYKYHDRYRLIAGERRTLASILAEKADIPAKVLTSRPDQLKLSLLQWIENIEREDLTLWERLRNLEKILSAYAQSKQKKVADTSPTELSQLLGCSLQQGINYR